MSAKDDPRVMKWLRDIELSFCKREVPFVVEVVVVFIPRDAAYGTEVECETVRHRLGTFDADKHLHS